jgi:hypothetical protein
MLIKLTYRNALAVPVLVRSNEATGQPLLPGQSLEMMFDIEPDADGVADLVLVVEPG